MRGGAISPSSSYSISSSPSSSSSSPRISTDSDSSALWSRFSTFSSCSPCSPWLSEPVLGGDWSREDDVLWLRGGECECDCGREEGA